MKDYDEALRQSWINSGWPYCKRCLAHFERKNWEQFDKEFCASDCTSTTPRKRLADLYKTIQEGFAKFTLNSPGRHQRVGQRLALARTTSPDLYKQLAEQHCVSGRILRLWNEIQNVRHAFITNYNTIQPSLRRDGLADGKELEAVYISDKSFDAVRQLYIDCFDTSCRLIVIAMATETIIHEKSLRIRMTNGSIPLEKFEQFPNAVKLDFMKEYPVAELFLPALDVNLRNGVRHHAAYYDPNQDQVVMHHLNDPRAVKSTLSYAEFCLSVTKLFAAFELATTYHHALHLDLDGRLS